MLEHEWCQFVASSGGRAQFHHGVQITRLFEHQVMLMLIVLLLLLLLLLLLVVIRRRRCRWRRRRRRWRQERGHGGDRWRLKVFVDEASVELKAFYGLVATAGATSTQAIVQRVARQERRRRRRLDVRLLLLLLLLLCSGCTSALIMC